MSSTNLNAHVELRPNGRLVVVYEIDALTDALALCVGMLHPVDVPELTRRLLDIAVAAMVAQKKPQSPALRAAITCAQDYLYDLIPDSDTDEDVIPDE